MSKMNFTPSQEDAINAKGGAILVSAAAGSGKTRVLVERVIRRLTDEENPIDADRFLIVTFTNAAANEMKKRISDAIDDRLAKDPDNTELRRQQLLLPRANISTVHSFCSNIIRENFYVLNVNQDFRIAEDSETAAMKNRVMSDIIEEMYAQKSGEFRLLSSILSGTKSDSGLEKAILDVYEKSLAHPFPEQWIAESVEFYNPDIKISDTIFAKKALEYIKSVIEYLQMLLDESYEIISANQFFECGKDSSGINSYHLGKNFIESLNDAVGTGQWSEVSDCVLSYTKLPYRTSTSKKFEVSQEEKDIVKNCFDSINKTVEEKLQPLFSFTEEIYHNDAEQLYPVMQCLQKILTEFNKRYEQAKNEKGILEFSDLEHLMIKLLIKQTDSGYEKTDFARNISKRFDEIMIDEYQDTNEIQELIFRAVSDDGKNIFVVGDVKQSIYGFREAMPEIFIRRREKASLYDRNNPQFPAKIVLDKNFRSRESVIDSVNYVFNLLMSKRVGDIDYNDEEKLVMGATYPEKKDTEFELHIINADKNSSENSENDDLSKDEKEARHIVDIINDMFKNGTTVTEKDGERPIQYSDICILLRNKSSHASVFSKVLNENGIPTHTDKSNSLFECYEVNVALSFLKIVDNPLQDIPLLSIMMSSVVGFTADDLAVIRKHKNQPLYKSVYLAARPFIKYSDSEENSDTEKETLTDEEIIVGKKCAVFIDELAYYRKLSVTVTVSKLLDVFFERTSYIEAVSAMKNGKIRVQNIRKMMNFIRNYESGSSGLTGFIRFLTHVEESGSSITADDTAPADSVSIMTIHHSKGLEFPVCIMASTASKGGGDKDAIHCHSQLGIGIKTIDTENMLKFSTFQRTVIDNENLHKDKCEALRVLYVAMTRAKEKLIVISSLKSTELNKIAKTLKVKDGKILPYNVENANTIAELIVMCALLHPSMSELRKDAGAENITTVPSKSDWKYLRVGNIQNSITETTEEYTEQIDNNFMEFLKTRFQQKYSDQSRTLIPSKVSASALAHNDSKFDFVAITRPAFMQEKKMTGTERGTAMHEFLQYADFIKIKDDTESEKQRILKEGFMSSEQINALNNDDINKFTQSELFSRMLNSEKLYKEYRFTVNIPAKDIDENADCDDSVILQGAIDCIFTENGELVIVDYKTDRVKDISELADRYSKQLKLYKNAAEQVFEMPVRECIIYSLHLGKQTTI
ncbi:MAG: helicase-exonuclease AddAB subunit AddA [Clostridia bacterium]|nr:helicase-exonuclease AddAB subunit AddA [Clostridia bacterium]